MFDLYTTTITRGHLLLVLVLLLLLLLLC